MSVEPNPSTPPPGAPVAATGVVRHLDVLLKGLLLLMLAFTVIDPAWANLEGKAAEARSIVYPLLAFTVPALWWGLWRESRPFPWLADLLVTITCFSDILGNRLDLYDRIVWFDDWMHFVNPALIGAAVVMLTLPAGTSVGRCLERSLAVGSTGAIAWEVGEYFAFISGSEERRFAYVDTLADLGLGVVGAVVGALVVHRRGSEGPHRAPAPVEVASSAASRATNG
ncbi:hypothetical protein [Nocardioides solisilvae]|uniref:hypothetical protein n=1 Tax=Nocardioides solisilvae TaxID=1542435 RepID=UPI000D741BAF|nr:hypothetical protein [Nocardioides solisilvae]